MLKALRVFLLTGLAATLLVGCAEGMFRGVGMPNTASTGQSSAGFDAKAPEANTGLSGSVGSDGDGGSGNNQQGGSLKGGELDDNGNFSQYLEYLAKHAQNSAPKVDVSERFPLRVVDQASKSVPNALVTVKLGTEPVLSAKTPANGRIWFHPRAFALTRESTADLTVEVVKGDLTVTRTLRRDESAFGELVLSGDRGTLSPKVDVCFVLDVTGSMGDELSQIQKTIGEISARIKSLPSEPSVRFGLVAFRDQGDDFLTRKTDFTSDLDLFKSKLNALAAAGGGDYPEAVNPALSEAINQLSWDSGESIRLTFLVGDAPPKLGEPQDVPYTTTMVKALEKGVKIFPLAASGLDALGEYVFRQLAQFTGGKFLFLTYGGGTSHETGPVQENNLDDLVVGIVKVELGFLE